jgi:hypothetical protein
VIALYLGAPRCGKSTLLRRHVYGSRVPGLHFLIVDRDGRGTWEGKPYTSAEAFRRDPLVPRFAVFRGVSGEEVAELSIALGSSVYVDEEAHRVVAEAYGPARKGRPASALYRIAHEGAHLFNQAGEAHEVGALLATHRPAGLPADLVACADSVYLGRTVLFSDAERAYREGWVPDARSPGEAQRRLGGLKPGEFLTTNLRG